MAKSCTCGCAAEAAPSEAELMGRLEDVLADPRAFAASADHPEFFWFPHTTVASTRRNHREGAETAPPLPGWRAVLDDEVLPTACSRWSTNWARSRRGWSPPSIG